jgi:hypothetical protein
MQQQIARCLKIVLLIGVTQRTSSLSQISLFIYALGAKLLYRIEGYKFVMWSQYTSLLLGTQYKVLFCSSYAKFKKLGEHHVSTSAVQNYIGQHLWSRLPIPVCLELVN